MKTLADGTEVSARSYYYLLDWNELNEWYYMMQEFGKFKLMDLTIAEYYQLFNEATMSERMAWQVKYKNNIIEDGETSEKL